MAKPQFTIVECDRNKGLSCYHIAFTPDGRHVVGFVSGDGAHKGLARWGTESGVLEDIAVEDTKHQAEQILLSDDGRLMAVRFITGAIGIYDATSRAKLAQFPGPCSAHSLSSDGKSLAIAFGNDVCCWSLAEGQKAAEVKLKEIRECDYARFISFAQDGTSVLLGRSTGIETWAPNSATTEQRVRFQAKDGMFWQHGVSPDKTVMLSLSDRGCLIQTDTRSWSSRRFAAVSNSYGSNFVFSPDGKLAACRTGHGTVFVWNVAEGQPWLKWSKPNYSNLGSIAFSRDGLRIACTLDFYVFVLDFRPGAAGRAIQSPATKAGEHRCVQMVGPDEQMDLRGGFGEPLNPLPTKCAHCRMLDLDSVTEPYLLGRGLEKPVDLAPAEAGNCLVRPSVRTILEQVAPGECRFVKTVHFKTKEPTAWFLAVPQRMETTATPPANRERCPDCGEPWCFHHYSESSDSWRSPSAPYEVFKSKNWGSPKAPFNSWTEDRPEIFGRMLYFSTRLETLLKKLKIRGMVRSYDCKDLPTAEDNIWVKQQLERLKGSSDIGNDAGQPAPPSTWFTDYLTKHAKAKAKPFDFGSLEKREGVKLPASYQDFAVRIGQKKFKNLNGDEGHELVIVPPAKLDFDTFRNPPEEGDDEAPKRAIVFGETNSGDSLCFAISNKGADPEVFYHNHETDEFEPFAKNFAECIRQLAKS